MTSVSRTLLAVAAAALFAAPAVAQDLTGTLKKIKESGTMTVGHREVSSPFSYYDDKQQPIGFAMDICAKVVDAVKKELKMPNLNVKYAMVTSATRIPLLANGTVDIECGSTTNNAARQEQVWFTNTHFVTASRYVTKKKSNINKIDDLKGKTVVSTTGTTNIKQLNDVNTERKLGINVVGAKDHGEAFLMVETDRAVAYVMDDILLASMVANAKTPGDYKISSDAFSLPEPYGIMIPRGDAAYKKLVDATTAALYKSPEIEAMYKKWFQSPIPPKNINMNFPMPASVKKAFQSPTDSPDPAKY